MAPRFLILNLIAFASALPLVTEPSAPCISNNFTLAMRITTGGNPAYASLNAATQQNGSVYLVAEPLSIYPGTQASFSGPSGSATLTLHLNPTDTDSCLTLQQGDFGLSIPDLGERYGARYPVLATKGYEWPHFYYAEGDVLPQLTAASQGWYACNTTIGGKEFLALSWGVYNSNGSAPWGCFPTSVKQDFNVPCVEASLE